ncbi:hypothetical protein MKX01_006508, partial [Papaver californicum]
QFPHALNASSHKNFSVAQMFNSSTQDWSLGITRRIKDHVISNVAGLLFALEENNMVLTNSQDKRVWMDHKAHGDFSVKKYYKWLARRSDPQKNNIVSPPKISGR